MIVGIVCPKCKNFTTEVHSHTQYGLVTFICRTCKCILEPPNGMRQYTVMTEM